MQNTTYSYPKNRAIKIYVAGKHEHYEPRCGVSGVGMPEDIPPSGRAPLIYKHPRGSLKYTGPRATYVGPWMCWKDHGFDGHGDGGGSGRTRETYNRCKAQIIDCDVFFVMVGRDFHLAHGSLVELGMAAALNKPIIALNYWNRAINDDLFLGNDNHGVPSMGGKYGENDDPSDAWFGLQACHIEVKVAYKGHRDEAQALLDGISAGLTKLYWEGI